MSFRTISFAVLLSASAAGPGSTDAANQPAPGDPHHAIFEGQRIDLAEGWGEARACAQLPDSTRCYRTEDEMDRELGEGFTLLACSSALRLYDGTSFGGAVLSLTTTGGILSLSSYGFDNRTSSYRVGACGATFYDTPSGSTPYPETPPPVPRQVRWSAAGTTASRAFASADEISSFATV